MMRRAFLLALLLLPGACGLIAPSGQRFVVFFQGSSDALDDSAKQVVAAAADYAIGHPDRPVTVAGFADPYGTAEVNATIVRARVDNVRAGLTGRGVPAARIQSSEVGKVEFALDSQESRRVVVTIGMP